MHVLDLVVKIIVIMYRTGACFKWGALMHVADRFLSMDMEHFISLNKTDDSTSYPNSSH